MCRERIFLTGHNLIHQPEESKKKVKKSEYRWIEDRSRIHTLSSVSRSFFSDSLYSSSVIYDIDKSTHLRYSVQAYDIDFY